MRYYLAVLFTLVAFGLPWVAIQYPDATSSVVRALEDVGSQLAAVILSHNPKSIVEIQSKYVAVSTPAAPKVRILIVPGHEPDFGGAEYSTLKERDMTVMLADNLAAFLNRNTHYQVFQTRSYHSWNPDFETYFTNSWDDIVAWSKASHAEFSQLVSAGTVKKSAPVIYHNRAPEKVATHLFGITKWANENNIDITIHVHFNDVPGHSRNSPGKNTGFSIYVPQKQYLNGTTTKAVAETVFKRLAKYNGVSDLAGESAGIVEEPDLIAIGVNNTSDAASLLIEYGYIYEPQFTNPDTQPLAIQDLAFQTYLGLEDFFGAQAGVSFGYDTLMIPHQWNTTITKKEAPTEDVFALQTALLLEGTYPPSNRSMNDCPRSGTFGPCTKAALDSFQKKYNITSEKEIVGPQTLNILNNLYSVKSIN